MTQENREEFFKNIIEYIKKQPRDFPDQVNRKLRKLETLEVAPPPPPRVPTREEIKALKQRDHQTLNALKVMIQPIMDQIQKKYRKFRNPVVPQSVIQYLFDEQEENYVRPDVVQFRPYELDKDKDGVPGLRDNATGKFLYNLETTMIEERLSNGYYTRPKDFVADIRSLAKDAKNVGDRERALKANELLANVEVDVALIEANPAMADCENVYLRQLQRTKEKEEKRRKRAEADARLVGSDIPADPNEQSEDGPVILGEPLPKTRPGLFESYSTPTTSLSNGHHATHSSHSLESQQRLSNGSSIPSTRHSGEDVHMSGTDSPSHLDSQTMPPPPPTISGAPLFSRSRNTQPSNATGISTQPSPLSQRSAFQSLPRDVSPNALLNDASTTTSGKKTSDPSTRSSGDASSTQRTNGGRDMSQFFSPSAAARDDGGGDSQLPDTQSQELWMHSQGQQRGPATSHAPTFPSSHVGSDNDLASTAGGTQLSSQKDTIVDEGFLRGLVELFVGRTEGWTVEELEMVYRECMECLWRSRGEWNRSRVGVEVADVFEEAVGEVERGRM
jgi:hypothetical protein